MKIRNYRASEDNLVAHIKRDCLGAERIHVEKGNYVTIRIVHPDDVITYIIDYKLYEKFKRSKNEN